MSKSVFIVSALLLLLLAALVNLVRVPSGTAYPLYSSSRTDPRGVALLYEALASSGRLTVQRHFLPPGQATVRGAAVFYLGMPAAALHDSKNPYMLELRRLAQNGNRVILGILADPPLSSSPSSPVKTSETQTEWDVTTLVHSPKFLNLRPGPSWTFLQPGLWERRQGSGTVVLLADAGRLGNRNLARSQAARDLVPALIADRRRILFDEAHLGVVESGSIAGLARRYRLEGLLAGLLLIFGLYLWKSRAAFPPPAPDTANPIRRLAGSATDTLPTLLRRHIAPAKLVETCIAEWNRVRPRQPLDPALAREPDPLAAYLTISRQAARHKEMT